VQACGVLARLQREGFAARKAGGLKMKSRSIAMLALVASIAALSPAQGQQKSITVASTTSTEQSGLFPFLLPAFTKKTGIEVKIVAVGTGQALDIGRRGDADVVFVHDKDAELKFLAEGNSTKRLDVMYNDFVIVGPKSDPAKAQGKDVLEGLRKISTAKQPFISRGDRSGTHAAELRYWKDAGVDLAAVKGDWYKEIGQGMGPTLNMASSTNGYALTDRGTWLSFKNRRELVIVVEGDTKLFNQYGVMLVNPAKHANVKAAEGQAFIDWLVSPEGQKTIAEYKIGGDQLFFPNASNQPRS
jgi:tungstate transport system substrate-binding protein